MSFSSSASAGGGPFDAGARGQAGRAQRARMDRDILLVSQQL
jgi:hypothetical protein